MPTFDPRPYIEHLFADPENRVEWNQNMYRYKAGEGYEYLVKRAGSVWKPCYGPIWTNSTDRGEPSPIKIFPPKKRVPFEDTRLALKSLQKAGILCGDDWFNRWVDIFDKVVAEAVEQAVERMKKECGE